MKNVLSPNIIHCFVLNLVYNNNNEAAKVLATGLSNGLSYQGYVGAEDSPL